MKLPVPLQNFVGLLRYAIVFQALYFLSIPIVIKSYDAASYGLYAIVFAMSSVIGSLGPLRLERAIVVEEVKYTRKIINQCVVSSLVASTLVMGICFIFLPSFSAPKNTVLPLAIIASTYSLMLSVIQILSHMAIKQERVTLTGISDVIYATLLIIGVLVVDIGSINQAVQLFLIFLVARGLSLVPYLRLTYKLFYPASENISSGNLRKYYTPVFTTFLSNTQFRGMFFLTSIYFSNTVTGNLSMAHRIMYAPVNLIGGSLRRAFFLEFTRNERDGTQLHHYIQTIWKYGSMVTSAIFPVFLILAHISQKLLPTDWQNLPSYGLAIYPAISMIVLLSWLDRLYDVHGKQKRALYYELAYTVLLYLGLIIALAFGVSITTLLLVYSTITTCYNLIWANVSLRLIDMHTRHLKQLAIVHFLMLFANALYFKFYGNNIL